jgi:hypothetical protein
VDGKEFKYCHIRVCDVGVCTFSAFAVWLDETFFFCEVERATFESVNVRGILVLLTVPVCFVSSGRRE